MEKEEEEEKMCVRHLSNFFFPVNAEN